MFETRQNDPETELACKECVELKDRLFSSEIDMDTFLRENAQLALKHGFDEIVPRHLPFCPEALRKYHQESEEERYRYKPEFWLRQDIKDYLETKEKVKNWNNGCVAWLKEILTHTDDPVQKKIITDRLEDFGSKQPTKEAQKIADQFGGTVKFGLHLNGEE